MSYKLENKPTRNTSSRSHYGHSGAPTHLCIHHWGSDGQKHGNVVDWLRGYTGNRSTSAHEVISAGLVTHMADFSRATWHAGSNKGNGEAVGLECRPEMSDGDWATLVERCVDIERELGSMKYTIHSNYKNTACPGRYSNKIDELIAAVNEYKASGKVPDREEGSDWRPPANREYETVAYGITLGLWDKGDPVKDWQDFLVDQGYKLGDAGVDGYFGADTEEPTKAFQEKHGLIPDGLAGDKTIVKAEALGLKWKRKPKKSAPKPQAGKLTVDGKWGKSTTREVQKLLGTPVDGEVSFQPVAYKAQNPGLLSGWSWTKNPRSSNVIEALQRKLGVTDDGRIGPNTIKALQRKLGTGIDGKVSNPSPMVKELQRNLNAGKLW